MQQTACCLAALALLAARPAASQVRVLEEGARVRISSAASVSGTRWVVGTVLASGPDSLTLLRADTRQSLSLHRREIAAVQVSTGVRRTAPTMVRYALVGGGIGASAGALLGAATYEDDDSGWEVLSRRDVALIFGVSGGLSGATLGGLLGWRSSGEEWTQVPFGATPTVALRPGGGVGVALSLKL